MPRIPWDSKSQYVLDKEEKTIYLSGSFMRSMALHHIETSDPVPGYKVLLCAPSTIEKLKAEPEYLDELKQQIKERENEQTTQEK